MADCDYSIKNKNINDTFKKRVKCFEVALRLVDDGDVWSPGMLKIDCWSGALISGSITYIDLMERKAQKEQQLKTYHLKKENLAVLRRLHKALTQDNFKVYNMLELPLNRFQRALVKIHEDDFIIDTTISLESSLLFNIRGELRYKFSLRGQRLLKKQSGVYEKLRDLYDIRSEIVHNGLHLHHKDIQKIINKHGGTHRSFLQDIKEIVREILKVIIFSVADLGDMNSFSEHLDNEILERIKKGVSR